MTNQVARLCESSLAILTSVIMCDFFDVSNQEGVPRIDAYCQNRPAYFVIVGREMDQDEVAVWLNRVSRNALFEVLFKQRQMFVSQTVTQAGPLGKESFLKFASFAHVVSHMSTPMNGDAAEEATIVPIGVERKDSVFVAQPIRKTPEAEEQRMAIQDDFDINHLGLFVSPLGVGSMLVFKTQLFLLYHPVL